MRHTLKAKLFRGFGDPARLSILETLRSGPQCVSELAKVTELLQPNLSMHLACLRECGLVAARRDGRFVYYELAAPGVARLLGDAEGVLDRVAHLIESCPRYKSGRNRLRARAGAQPLASRIRSD